MKKTISNKTNIIASIIICTYNRASLIVPCIKSLLNQNFNNDNYEIIVVDDGSTDETITLIDRFPIKIVQHKKNKGIPTARNTGIKMSKGKFIVFIDDDCIAKEDWLKTLIDSYSNKSILAVGGITNTKSQNSMVEKYMHEIGYGNPAPLEFRDKFNPITRFFIYFKHMLNPFMGKTGSFEVQEIYTLNASYRKDVLIKIGLFDTNLYSFEDVEVSNKIHRHYPYGIILFNTNAVIYHKHRNNLFKYLKENITRSKNTLIFYRNIKKTPPIFPFPIILFTLFIFATILNFNVALCLLIILPMLIYPWWITKTLRYKKIKYIIFPFIQLLHELSTILGILYYSFKLKNISYDN